MCGIVGYISNNDKLYEGPKEHFMRYALALDTLRGEDSTGLITLNKRFTVKTLRTTMAGDEFVHSSEYKKKYRPGWAQIGHNRAATRGVISMANAHPFTFGPICMVHNGTLHAGGSSLETFDRKIGAVDSMQIAYALSKYPPEEADKVLSQIDGSFALVWTDSRDESVNMTRNSERPLHFTFNNKKSILWYMSDGHHLHSINRSFGNHECRGNSIFEMDKHKILKFRKGATKPEVTKFSPFVPKSHYPNYSQIGTKSKEKNTGSGGKMNKSAEEKATEKWKRTRESGSTSTSTDGRRSTHKVSLQGRMRKIPDPMLRSLARDMYLSPSDLLQFQPDDAEELPTGGFVVYGTMIHSEWGDIPWDMTIHNVPKVQWMAYKDADWLVRPVGMCPPHDYNKANAAVLGHLIHTDWTGYQNKLSEMEESSDDDKEGDPTAPTVRDGNTLVAGPNGSLILWRRLEPMLDAGCINCGTDLLGDTDVSTLMIVNNGIDLICEGCVIELYQPGLTKN